MRGRHAVYTMNPFDFGDAFVFQEPPHRRSHRGHGPGFAEANCHASASSTDGSSNCQGRCHARHRGPPFAAAGPHRRRHHHHHHHRHRKPTPEPEEPKRAHVVTPWGTYVYYVNDDASDADTEAEQDDVAEATQANEQPDDDDVDLEVVEVPDSPDVHEPAVEVPKSPELGLSASDVSDDEVLEAFRELKARVEAQEAAERAAEQAREKARVAREKARERKEAERRRLEEAAREEEIRNAAIQAALEEAQAVQAALQEEAEEKARAEEKRARREARKLEKRRHKEEQAELKSKHAKTEVSTEPFEVVEEADQAESAELEQTFAKYSTLLDAVEERVNRISNIDLNGRKKTQSFISLVESYYPKIDKVYLKLDDLRVPKEYRKQKHNITARAVGMADRLDALLEKLKNTIATLNETEAESDSSVSSGSHRYTVTLEDVDDSDSS